MKTVRVGCIGLGNMGAHMAANVVAGGFEVSVFDVRPEPLARFAGLGARIAQSPNSLAAGVDVLMVNVLNDAQVDDVLVSGSDGGALASMAPGSIVVVHSTVSPATCRRLADLADARGVGFIDAPVSGGERAAAEGTLTLMVGGTTDSLSRARAVLDAVSATLFHVGDVGAGQTAKLVNNLLGIMTRIVVAEGMALTRAVGLDEDAVLEVVSSSTGDSWQVANWHQMQAIARASTSGPEGMAAMSRKDLSLALELAAAHGIQLPVTRIGLDHTEGLFGEHG